jgi:hypothetical protein
VKKPFITANNFAFRCDEKFGLKEKYPLGPTLKHGPLGVMQSKVQVRCETTVVHRPFSTFHRC